MPVGCDIGTCFIVSCRKENNQEGDVFRSMRNCFLKFEGDDADWIKQIKDITTVDIGDDSYILGDDALGFSTNNLVVRRPMQHGIINPLEDDALRIIAEIVKIVCGPAAYPGEVACASIPANTSDGRVNNINHAALVQKIFEDLGYHFIGINESLAVVYANNPKAIDDEGNEIPFSGIGISMGGGMVNVCYAHRGIEQMSFSLPRSGDYIDTQVSEACGRDPLTNELRVKPSKVIRIKENHLNLMKDSNDYSDAQLRSWKYTSEKRQSDFRKIHTYLVNYYKDLIEYVLAHFVAEFKKKNIDSDHSIDIVISGGTSMPTGIVELFAERLSQMKDFPFEVNSVVHSPHPLESTALGSLTKAIIEERKITK